MTRKMRKCIPALVAAVGAVGLSGLGARAGVVLNEQYINVQYSTAANFSSGVTNVTTAATPGGSGPLSVSIPQGDYFRFGITASVGTTDPNGAAGQAWDNNTNGNGSLPADLGLAALGVYVPVSANDSNGSILQPVLSGSNTDAAIYQGTGTAIGNPSTGSASASNGQAGTIASPISFNDGTTPNIGTQSGINEISMFGATTSSGSQAATSKNNAVPGGDPQEFFQNLEYQATGAGVVTLSPTVLGGTAGSLYFAYTNPSQVNNAAVAPTYQATAFTNTGDTINQLSPITVTVTSSSTPEPASLGVLGLGGVGLLARLRSRKGKKIEKA